MRLGFGLRASLTALAAAAALSVVTVPVAAQGTGSIQGTVINANTQQPLEAVQVFIPGTEFGTLTDARGRFLLLNVPEGSRTVRAELIGFRAGEQSVTVTAGQAATANLTLQPTALKMNELVVTGVVGSTPKTKVPFTVDKVDADELPVPAVNAQTAIQGKVAGVQVVTGDGTPGSQPSVLLRGATSINASGRSQDPLYIVDGVIVSGGLGDISAEDIESVEVVKGAAAASLYGSRAANGVISITTKRGSSIGENASHYTFRTEYGRSDLQHKIHVAQLHPFAMNANKTAFVCADTAQGAQSSCPVGTEFQYYDTAYALQMASYKGGVTTNTFEAFLDNPYPPPTWNQVDRFFDAGNYMTNYLSLEGRRGSTNYYVSFNNLDQQGVVIGTDGYKRQNFRVNVDHGLSEDLQLSVSSFYSYGKQDRATGDFFGLTFVPPASDLLMYVADPHVPLNLTPIADPRNTEEDNPIYENFNRDYTRTEQRFMGSALLRYSPVNWFDVEGNVSYDRTDGNNSDYYPKGYRTREPSSLNGGRVQKLNDFSDALNGSLTGSFHKAFGDLTMRNKLRYLFESDTRQGFQARGNTLAVQGVPTLGAATDVSNYRSYDEDVRAEGYFFITGLDYKGKYIGDFLVRRDGSSLFGADQRWQTYYRVSGAWRPSQEGWWFAKSAIPELKLRASYGTAGGRPNFYAQYETYSISSGNVTPETLGNTELKPEYAQELSAGVDALLFNKVSATVTYSRTTTSDQILQVPLPAFMGFGSQWRNAGTLESKTWEGSLESQLYQSRNVSWSARLLGDRTKSTITEFSVPPYQWGPGAAFYNRAGEVYGTIYGHKFATSCADLPSGMSCDGFQVNNDGYLVYVGSGNTYQDGISKQLWGTSADVNGATYNWGTPFYAQDANGNTFLPLGNVWPNLNLSFSNTLTWKGLTLYGLLDGSWGFDIYNQTRQWAYREQKGATEDQVGVSQGLMKPLGYYETLYDVNAINSEFVEKGNFMKLRELSLRYALSPSNLQSLGLGGVSRLSLSLSGRNLYTWTNYSGYDPEVGSSGGEGGSAAITRFDNYFYPNYRTVTAAVEVVF